MLLQDLRYGARMLLKSPGFTSIAVMTLALGIGANTAVFSLVNSILLRQLPFRQPEQLVRVYSRRPAPGKYSFTLPDFIDYRDQNQSLSGIAAYASWSANLTDQGEPEQLQGLRISDNAFELLGVEAVAGRALAPGDDAPGQQHVAVLSHGLWRRRFGADPQLVGKTADPQWRELYCGGRLAAAVFLPDHAKRNWRFRWPRTPIRCGACASRRISCARWRG